MNNSIMINTIGAYLKEYFGEKVVKLSLDGGFTCPNRDGSKGVGGCTFCSSQGSGELSSNITDQISLLEKKWPRVSKYIAYFQSHTSTYDNVDILRDKYDEALDHPFMVGLAIATRPDCLSQEILDLLEEYNQRTFLWVELGLQTIHEDRINRCYPLSTYEEAVDQLVKRGIRVVTHLILGLPQETKEDMVRSVSHVCGKPIFGLKLHMLNIVKGAPLSKTHPDYSFFSSPEDYVDFICQLLEIIPRQVTIHRLTGDVPRHLLMSPTWSYKKRTILNGIVQQMEKKSSFQGKQLSP